MGYETEAFGKAGKNAYYNNGSQIQTPQMRANLAKSGAMPSGNERAAYEKAMADRYASTVVSPGLFGTDLFKKTGYTGQGAAGGRSPSLASSNNSGGGGGGGGGLSFSTGRGGQYSSVPSNVLTPKTFEFNNNNYTSPTQAGTSDPYQYGKNPYVYGEGLTAGDGYGIWGSKPGTNPYKPTAPSTGLLGLSPIQLPGNIAGTNVGATLDAMPAIGGGSGTTFTQGPSGVTPRPGSNGLTPQQAAQAGQDLTYQQTIDEMGIFGPNNPPPSTQFPSPGQKTPTSSQSVNDSLTATQITNMSQAQRDWMNNTLTDQGRMQQGQTQAPSAPEGTLAAQAENMVKVASGMSPDLMNRERGIGNTPQTSAMNPDLLNRERGIDNTPQTSAMNPDLLNRERGIGNTPQTSAMNPDLLNRERGIGNTPQTSAMNPSLMNRETGIGNAVQTSAMNPSLMNRETGIGNAATVYPDAASNIFSDMGTGLNKASQISANLEQKFGDAKEAERVAKAQSDFVANERKMQAEKRAKEATATKAREKALSDKAKAKTAAKVKAEAAKAKVKKEAEAKAKKAQAARFKEVARAKAAAAAKAKEDAAARARAADAAEARRNPPPKPKPKRVKVSYNRNKPTPVKKSKPTPRGPKPSKPTRSTGSRGGRGNVSRRRRTGGR